ncbi:MAG: MMPL family transporter, partial [Acidimicrobiales bacterium]|nr:MMPL family transporter [Acidimicrobiales bacterium]
MSHALYRLGRWTARHPWRTIVAWVVLAVVVITASVTWGRELRDSFNVPGVDSDRATQLLSTAQSADAGVTARVVATPRDAASLSGAEAGRALAELREELSAIDGVVAVTAPQLSGDGKVALLTVQYPVLEDLDSGDLTRLKDVLDHFDDSALRVEAGGELFFHLEAAGGGSSEAIGILAAVVILLIAFGSVVAMGLPIVTALVGLAIGMSSLGLVTYLIEIPSDAPGMAAMVGIGVGIDYALFLVTRYREFVASGSNTEDAVGRSLATAGQAVLFAGGTVVVAILGLAVAGVPMMTAAGVATSTVVAVEVVAALTLLPALVALSASWIDRLSIHRRGTAPSGRRAAQWAGHVSRHPWPYAVGGTLALLALTVPMFRLELGFPDEGTMPPSRTERRAYDLVSDGFGPGVNGPLLIAVDLSGATGDPTTILADLGKAVSADEGIATVYPAQVDRGSRVATIVAIPTTKPQAAATYDTVKRLRSDVFPGALDGSGASAHVGGATANFGDIAGRVTDRLPLFVGSVLLLSFLLLMVVFRSVLVPLKAALLNLLSIGAAYGVMVMVFQWGWGKDLIGLDSTLPIVSLIPMFMFAVLFGLSMDY